MPPFSVMHVCMGNICRSPMAERLLLFRAREALGEHADRIDELLLSHSTGSGGWHQGQSMNPPAAQQLRMRGIDHDGFAARQLASSHVDSSDLILTATAEHAAYVASLRPDAAARTFVLGEFGRLLRHTADRITQLPASEPTAVAVQQRGEALVHLVDQLRAGSTPRPSDDLDDPWGLNDSEFARVADEIDATVRPLASALLRG